MQNLAAHLGRHAVMNARPISAAQAEPDNLRTLMATIDMPTQRAESAGN